MSAFSSRRRAAQTLVTHPKMGVFCYSRRNLAIAAMAFTAMMASVPALPASADVVYEEVPVQGFQTFTAAAVVAEQPVVRDEATIVAFSAVQMPVPAGTPISDFFGYRSCAGCSSDHQGIDYTPGNGFPIPAIADGVVSQTGNPSGALGVFIVIDHVIDGRTISSTYAHMQNGSLAFAVGDTVRRGDIVGLVGDTGQSTGPHLHFGIMVNGVVVDPLPWLQENVNS